LYNLGIMKEGPFKKDFKKYTAPVLGLYFEDFEVVAGTGCYLYGTDGKKYLDFSSGIAVCSTGHCHPKVVKAVTQQLNKLIHVCIGVALYEPYIKLSKELAEIVPMPDAQVFLCQSGSEAVESAIKLAKYTTKKPGMIAFKGCFHGRTLGALSLTTSKMKYREGYEPLVPESYISEFDLKLVEGLLKTRKIAGVIIEPILGEGGYIQVEKKFMKGLRKLCDKYKALLIVDEVQSGFGRTGKWFAIDHYGIKPDVMTLAKGIASGFTLGACVAKGSVMAKWSPGSHGGTYGGNPINCTGALATLEIIKKEKLIQNAEKMGEYLKACLLKLQDDYGVIKEVRGLGLMIGVDFGDASVVRKLMDKCLEMGLVLISTGGGGTVIRFVPALIVNKKQIDTALSIFEKALQDV